MYVFKCIYVFCVCACANVIIVCVLALTLGLTLGWQTAKGPFLSNSMPQYAELSYRSRFSSVHGGVEGGGIQLWRYKQGNGGCLWMNAFLSMYVFMHVHDGIKAGHVKLRWLTLGQSPSCVRTHRCHWSRCRLAFACHPWHYRCSLHTDHTMCPCNCRSPGGGKGKGVEELIHGTSVQSL